MASRAAATSFISPMIPTVFPRMLTSAPVASSIVRRVLPFVPMIDYLKVFERSSNLFPGFETEVQGLYRERDEAGAVRFHTYVVRE